jgi:SAM-dependent methyltransferase
VSQGDAAPAPADRFIGERLRAGGEVKDSAFDALLTGRAREKSPRFWTAVEVARTAARWLEAAGATRVLDVGAGVGKFCAVASLTIGHRVWGLERRGALVYEARLLAQRLGAEVVMVEGTLRDVDPSEYDGFYFFNPFGEYVAEEDGRFDDDFPKSVDGYIEDARIVERWLRRLPLGACMVTYNGIGVRIPMSWKVQRSTELAGDMLRLWKKDGVDQSADAWLEVGEELIPATRLAALAKKYGATFADSPLVARLVEPDPG